jgi:hypothetical protein
MDEGLEKAQGERDGESVGGGRTPLWIYFNGAVGECAYGPPQWLELDGARIIEGQRVEKLLAMTLKLPWRPPTPFCSAAVRSLTRGVPLELLTLDQRIEEELLEGARFECQVKSIREAQRGLAEVALKTFEYLSVFRNPAGHYHRSTHIDGQPSLIDERLVRFLGAKEARQQA